jgi:hypothetical protein
MVVNYDLPLMNERDKTADERPDIETYIHRIGQLFFPPTDKMTLSLLQVARGGLGAGEFR